MRTLVLGTKNAGKQAELQDILLGIPLRLRPLPTDVPEAPEEAETLAENAASKACYYAERLGELCLADDTGLVVDALGGAPGVRSARYAGPKAKDADNRHKLLAALEGKPRPWTARFLCVVCVASPAGELLVSAEGALEGAIVARERGDGGFGYDPIFVPTGDSRTLAELSAADKNGLSHRARALAALRPRLLELL